MKPDPINKSKALKALRKKALRILEAKKRKSNKQKEPRHG
jgi:hypothetical protein